MNRRYSCSTYSATHGGFLIHVDRMYVKWHFIMVFISVIKITKESKELTALFFTGVYFSVNCLFMCFDPFSFG